MSFLRYPRMSRFRAYRYGERSLSLIFLHRHRSLETLRPDIRDAYTITMAVLYSSSVTFDGVYKNPGLRTEIVVGEVISCIPQYIEWLERGNQ
jgi:hypothetical protein